MTARGTRGSRLGGGLSRGEWTVLVFSLILVMAWWLPSQPVSPTGDFPDDVAGLFRVGWTVHAARVGLAGLGMLIARICLRPRSLAGRGHPETGGSVRP